MIYEKKTVVLKNFSTGFEWPFLKSLNQNGFRGFLNLKNKTIIRMKIRTILPIIAFIATIVSCGSNPTTDQLGDYFRRNDFAGIRRMYASSFVINGVSYISTGFTGTNNSTNSYTQETWKLDTTINAASGGNWQQVANFPGVGRSQAVGFSDGKYGYVGTGLDINGVYLKDFHLYDPTTNKWDTVNNTTAFKVMDFAGGGRYGACSFALNSVGYVGSGSNDNTLLDFYRYSFSGNTWSQIAQLGHKTVGATAFVVNNLGYVVGGADGSGSYSKYFFEYNPSTNNWANKRQIINATDSSFDDLYTSIQRQNGVALVIQSPIVNHPQVYFMQGQNGSALNSCWQWDPPTDQWVIQNPYPGSPRFGAVAIQFGGRGFFATGGSSAGASSSSLYDNVVEYLPGIALNTNDWQ